MAKILRLRLRLSSLCPCLCQRSRQQGASGGGGGGTGIGCLGTCPLLRWLLLPLRLTLVLLLLRLLARLPPPQGVGLESLRLRAVGRVQPRQQRRV